MKALLVYQPFASLLAAGAQHVVSLPPDALAFAGLVALYAVGSPPDLWERLPPNRRDALGNATGDTFGREFAQPGGCVLGIATALPAVKMSALMRETIRQQFGDREVLLSNLADGRTALQLEGARAFRVPLYVARTPGAPFFDLPDAALPLVRAAALALDTPKLGPAVVRELERLTAAPAAVEGAAG